MDDETPGLLVKKIPKTFLNIKDIVKNNPYLHFMLYILKKARSITNIYLDLVKDLLLVITIVSALGGFEVIFGNIKVFPSVVVMNLIATIIFPLVISTFLTLSENPEMIFCMDFTDTSIFFKSLIRIFILPLFLLVPALIVNAVDVVKETIDDMINKKSIISQDI